MTQPDRFDWDTIQSRYEAGETAGTIAKIPGMPSRQMINRKARKEGWERKLTKFPVADTETTLTLPVKLDPRRKAALEVIARGGTFKDAAAAATVSESTFREWRRDPSFSALVESAATAVRLEMLEHVRQGAARDAKHAQWWLQHHPHTRGEFGHGAAAPTIGNQYNVLAGISLGIDRGGPVIEVTASAESG